MPRRPAPVRSIAAIAAMVLAVGACGPVVELSVDGELDFVEQPRTSRILAPDGTVLADLHGGEDRDEVPLDEVAGELIAAVISVEDRRFFRHGGVDLTAIARAAIRNVELGEIDQGGSTITQQLVKTTMTGPARTVQRKLEEALLAVRLEREHSKEQILERYLNTVYFGRGAYGVAAASRRFFGVGPDELSLPQAALLAGVIASPSSFDPWDEPDAATNRRRAVLGTMVETGQIDRETALEAGEAPIELAPPSAPSDGIASWISAEVRRQLQRDPDGRFAAALGESVDERVEALFTGGLRVTTTVDLEAQAETERAIAERLTDDGPAIAVVALDPATGAIRALVGGRAQDADVGFNLATQGRRSPGSAFKPIVLAAALQRGVSLDRSFPGGACVVIPEVPGWDEEGACNYNGTEYGPLTLREATVRSANTVYARLATELGPAAIIQQARQLGISGDLAEVHALGLGSEDVSVLDLASAYGAFATLGEQARPYLVQRIEDAEGRVLYEHDEQRLRVMDDQAAWLVTDTLADVVTRGTGVRAAIGRPQAGKTGTSQDNADAWYVGYTPDLVAAVWVGFPEGRIPLRPPNTEEVIEGGRWPAEIWARVATAALATTPATAFPEPQVQLLTVEVDVSRNCLPNPYTPSELIEARDFLVGTQPTERCTEPTGPALDDVPQVIGLPGEVATRLLAERGFEVEVRAEHSRVFPPGIVTRQRPSAGEDLEVDGVVVIWSSVSSRDRIAPSDALGLPLDEAIAQLEGQGFVVEVERSCPCSLPPGTVHGQRPGPGVPTLRADVITLVAVPEDPPDEIADEIADEAAGEG